MFPESQAEEENSIKLNRIDDKTHHVDLKENGAAVEKGKKLNVDEESWILDSEVEIPAINNVSTPRKNTRKSAKLKSPHVKQIRHKMDPNIEILIENNRINIENLEKVFLHSSEVAEMRYLKLEDSFNQLQRHAESSQTKYEKEILQQRSRYEKQIEDLRAKIEKDNHVLLQKTTEIAVLQSKVNHQKELLQLHNNRGEDLKDMEVRIRNKIQEEKIGRDNSNMSTQQQLDDLKAQIKKKAQQSDVDKALANPLATNTSIQNIQKQLDDLRAQVEKKSQQQHDLQKCSSGSPAIHNNDTSHDPYENQGRSDRSEQSDESEDEEKTGHVTNKKIIKENVVLLMDSNRNHINEEMFWNKTRKIRVATAAELEGRIDEFDFRNVEHIIIGTGTNDTDHRKAEEIFPDIMKGVQKLRGSYSSTNIYVSQIPPRNKFKKGVVDELNSLIDRGLPESVNVILQQDLEARHLRDEKHIKERHIGLYAKNMKDKIKEVLGITPKQSKNYNEKPRRSKKPRDEIDKYRHAENPFAAQIKEAIEQALKGLNKGS